LEPVFQSLLVVPNQVPADAHPVVTFNNPEAVVPKYVASLLVADDTVLPHEPNAASVVPNVKLLALEV